MVNENSQDKRERDDVMATSTFGKEFRVERKIATDFVKEMEKPTAPTLKKEFQTKSTHAREIKDLLTKALLK